MLIVFSPFIGGALAAWVAYDRDRNSDLRMRNVALALLVLAVAMFLLPGIRFGILFRLFS